MMGVETVTYFQLVCDCCGEPLVGEEGEPLECISADPLQLDARAGMGWTTDGRGAWHCRTCPELEWDDGSHIIPGQLSLGSVDDEKRARP